MNIFNIIVGVLTIAGFVYTIWAFIIEINKNKRKRKRTQDILQENIKENSKVIIYNYDKFNYNYNQYKSSVEMQQFDEYQFRLDLVSYFIHTYGNNSFLDSLKSLKSNIEEYYINNIDDSKFNYIGYSKLKKDIKELIQKLEYYKYQTDMFIQPYDDFLKYNLNQKIIHNSQNIPNDLVSANFNGTGNDAIINPIIYYKSLIRIYDDYFNDLNNLSVPLLYQVKDSEMSIKSFVNMEFGSVHEEVKQIIRDVEGFKGYTG